MHIVPWVVLKTLKPQYENQDVQKDDEKKCLSRPNDTWGIAWTKPLWTNAWEISNFLREKFKSEIHSELAAEAK